MSVKCVAMMAHSWFATFTNIGPFMAMEYHTPPGICLILDPIPNLDMVSETYTGSPKPWVIGLCDPSVLNFILKEITTAEQYSNEICITDTSIHAVQISFPLTAYIKNRREEVENRTLGHGNSRFWGTLYLSVKKT